MIYLIAEEILLQQAKLLWDDLRDRDRDKQLPLNSRRPLASGGFDTHTAIVQMVTRWLLALPLGYLIGGVPLLGLFIVISLHQALYELWSKPRMHKHPLQALFVISFNIALRFLAGAMAIAGPRWTYAPLIILFCMFYFASLGGMAIIWRLEGEKLAKENQDMVKLKPQAPFYMAHGRIWQHTGLVGAIVLPVFLAITQRTSCTLHWSVIETWYGSCRGLGPGSYVELGIPWSVAGVCILILATLIISLAIVALSRIIGFVATGSAALFLAGLYFLGSNPCAMAASLVASNASSCPLDATSLLALANSTGIASQVITAAFLTLLCTILVLVSRWISSISLKILPTVKLVLLPACYIFAYVLFADAVLQQSVLALFDGFVLLNFGYLIMYEGMTYEEYSLELLRKRLPLIAKAWYAYFFRPIQGLGFLQLLALTFSDVDYKLPPEEDNSGDKSADQVPVGE